MEVGKRVHILLSTYNGESYLDAQLDSYETLTGVGALQVLIRDDGSQDGTRGVLERWARKPGFHVEYGKHMGLNASYSQLIRHCDLSCDYFAISDQDDIWLPGKLETAIKMMEAQDGEGPALFFSRSTLIDSGGTQVGQSASLSRGVSFYNAMVQNPAPGHTQVLNRAMMQCLQTHLNEDMYVFDWWVYLLATALGRVLYVPESTVLHRQHDSNTLGYETGWAALLRQRLRRVLRGDGNAVARQLVALLDAAGNDLPRSYREELVAFLRQGIFNRLCYALGGRAFRQGRWDSILFRCAYLLGAYRINQ